MTYLYEAITPTRIYIKECPHCGRRYLGKHVGEDIEAYKGSGVDWTKHLKEHRVEPIHVWNSDWFYDKSIVEYALALSEEYNITKSDQWFNLKPENGLDGGNTSTPESITKRKATVNNPIYKATKGADKNAKISKAQKEIQSNSEWQNTKGIEKSSKMKKTINDPVWIVEVGMPKRAETGAKLSVIFNDPEWISTKGAEKSAKISTKVKAKRNDPEWKATTGSEAKIKLIATVNDPEWISTKGVKRRKNQSDARKNLEWKEQDNKICEFCSKVCDSGNYARWHGQKCKHNPINHSSTL
jgi:hypothetical protein